MIKATVNPQNGKETRVSEHRMDLLASQFHFASVGMNKQHALEMAATLINKRAKCVIFRGFKHAGQYEVWHNATI